MHAQPPGGSLAMPSQLLSFPESQLSVVACTLQAPQPPWVQAVVPAAHAPLALRAAAQLAIEADAPAGWVVGYAIAIAVVTRVARVGGRLNAACTPPAVGAQGHACRTRTLGVECGSTTRGRSVKAYAAAGRVIGNAVAIVVVAIVACVDRRRDAASPSRARSITGCRPTCARALGIKRCGAGACLPRGACACVVCKTIAIRVIPSNGAVVHHCGLNAAGTPLGARARGSPRRAGALGAERLPTALCESVDARAPFVRNAVAVPVIARIAGVGRLRPNCVHAGSPGQSSVSGDARLGTIPAGAFTGAAVRAGRLVGNGWRKWVRKARAYLAEGAWPAGAGCAVGGHPTVQRHADRGVGDSPLGRPFAEGTKARVRDAPFETGADFNGRIASCPCSGWVPWARAADYDRRLVHVGAGVDRRIGAIERRRRRHEVRPATRWKARED